jgi:branched-subunit amino acid aminotransferase/4-amino-4-deoxychorismate lyase
MATPAVRGEVNGRPATAGSLQHLALTNYGHFTAMQVRDRRTRGLALHLGRLQAATRELFGTGLDADRVRSHIRHALGSDRDASVRVTVFWPDGDDVPAVLVTVRPPAEMPAAAQSLMPARYQRPVPHIKHIGGFGQSYYNRLAASRGFDGALLVAPDGVIAEGSITNIAFFDEETVTWPDAPCLAGITMQLVEPRLASSGLPSRRAPVRLTDLPSFTAAFVTNSRGIAPVGQIDSMVLPVSPALMKTVGEIYASIPWDPI